MHIPTIIIYVGNCPSCLFCLNLIVNNFLFFNKGFDLNSWQSVKGLAVIMSQADIRKTSNDRPITKIL